MKHLEWAINPFSELSLEQFHDILRLRVNVFVVEQNCPYEEVDGQDFGALHVTGMINGALLAYARIILPMENDPHIHIGRVVTAKSERGSGLGHTLMQQCMLYLADHHPEIDIALAAQSHLTDFYAKHGFKPIGEEYAWDGIPHRDMILEKG